MPRWAEVAGHTLWFYYREEHRRPHVAVRGEHRASLDLHTGEILAGRLPPRLHRIIVRYLREHAEEALAGWEAVRRAETPGSILNREVSGDTDH